MPGSPASRPYRRWRRWPILSVLLVLGGCSVSPVNPSSAAAPVWSGGDAVARVEDALAEARHARGRSGARALRHWLGCGVRVQPALAAEDLDAAEQAAALLTGCTRGFVEEVLRERTYWSAGAQELDGVPFDIVLRDASPNLGPEFRILIADQVPMSMFRGERHSTPGLGVPVVLLSPRCDDRPACRLLPPSGVSRSATAWLEPGTDRPRLVLGHPVRTGTVAAGTRRWPLASDSSAFYAANLQDSPIRRISLLNLLGGNEMRRRAGVYLLEDYDPRKRTLVMIHGLGSSPLTWARLSNAVWADPQLRSRYQVWQLVYETNDPMLVGRLRVQDHLDAAWRLLDPEGNDPARNGIVLVGHSMGGAISRLLLADSGEALWNAAFTMPPSSLRGNAADLDELDRMFRFHPYPGVRRAVFMAAPHRGSPKADSFMGRLANALVGRRTEEIKALRRVASDNIGAVPADLRAYYLEGPINSISTLGGSRRVMQAARALPVAVDVPYHSIIGELAGTSPPGDGVVPVSSAFLPGARSTLIVPSGHSVHEHDLAIAEVVRILHEDSDAPASTGSAAAACGGR